MLCVVIRNTMKNRFNFYVSKHDHELLEFLNNYGQGFNQYVCNLIKHDISHQITLSDIMNKLNHLESNLTLKTHENKENNEIFEFNDTFLDFSSDDF